MKSRLVVAFGGAVLLAASVATLGAWARSDAKPSLLPINATFDEASRATVYTVRLETVDGRPLEAEEYAWKLDAPADDTTCKKFVVSATKPNEATWFHAGSDGCTHDGTDHAGGTVSVTVKYKGYTCTATYKGSKTGRGEEPSECVSSTPACVGERAAVGKWASIVEQLEGQIADAQRAWNSAESTVSQAKGELENVIEEGTGFWDKLAGGGAYRNRYDAAAGALSKAEKALAEIKTGLRELKQELREAKAALAKANAALEKCLGGARTVSRATGVAACEAEASSFAAAKAAQATAVRVQIRLRQPATRALAATHGAAVLLEKPAPNLPAALRADIARAAAKTLAAERALSKFVSGLTADVQAAKRRVASAAAKLAACQKRLG